MMFARVAHFVRALQRFEYVIFTDIDTVWRENPLPFMHKDKDVSILQVRHHYLSDMSQCAGLGHSPKIKVPCLGRVL